MRKYLGLIVAAVAGMTFSAVAESRMGPFVSALTATGGDTASGAGGGLKYEWLSDSNLGFDLYAGYINDGDLGLIPFEAGPVVSFPVDPVSLYLGAGGGYFFPTDSDYNAALGFYALAGVRIPLSENLELFAEGQYVSAKGSEKKETTYFWNGWTTHTTQLDFSGVGANLGLLWKF